MGYRVHKAYKRSDGSVRWRLIYETYQGNKRQQLHISKSEYPKHGFQENLKLEEAVALAKSYNLYARKDQLQKRRIAISERLRKAHTSESIYLPQVIISQFEEEVILKEFSKGDVSSSKFKRFMTHWLTSKKNYPKDSNVPLGVY